MKQSVLITSIAFSPNVGGVETHLLDLIEELAVANKYAYILTYQPLQTHAKAPFIERDSKRTIVRLPIIRGLLYKLVTYPFFEFLFLAPLMFFTVPFAILAARPRSVYAQGLAAGGASILWSKILGVPFYIGLHSVYTFPQGGLYRWFSSMILTRSDGVLTMSHQSERELIDLGVKPDQITVFTYWVNEALFSLKSGSEKIKLRQSRGFATYDLVVLFVGRLIQEKGILELLEAAARLPPNILLVIAGDGPLSRNVELCTHDHSNVRFVGKLAQKDVSDLLNAVDYLIVPSVHDEGFPRVIVEALLSGTPVIGSNRGGIKEALNSDIGVLIDITPENIIRVLKSLSKDPKRRLDMAKNTTKYAMMRFGKTNAMRIINNIYPKTI